MATVGVKGLSALEYKSAAIMGRFVYFYSDVR